MESSHFFVMGDPIREKIHQIKIKSDHLLEVGQIEQNAGATHCWRVLWELNGRKNVYFMDFMGLSHHMPILSQDTPRARQTFHYTVEPHTLLLATRTDFEYAPHPRYAWENVSGLIDPLARHFAADSNKYLVISDHNYGTVVENSCFQNPKPQTRFKFGIAISERQALDTELLCSSERKIFIGWEDENNPEWIRKHFDYSILVNQNKCTVRQLYGDKGKEILLIRPHRMADPHGSRDTLIAATAAHLAQNSRGVRLESLCEATEFAINLYVESLEMPLNYVTSKKVS